jgi:hypothetical protein
MRAGGTALLDPNRALFVLHERGFYEPADWHLQLI